jgi:D-galactarolactone cycloisomerase
MSFYVVRLVTDDGVEGWSAFTAAGSEKAGLGEALAKLFLGCDPTDIASISERIKILCVRGDSNWWLEPAFWDIKAKLAGLPLYKLLGGSDDRLRLYASSGDLRDPMARRDEAEERFAEGFTTFKIRVHDWDERVDILHITDIARHMEGRLKVAVDCNQAFRLTQFREAPLWSLDRAMRFADAAADVGLAWVEEPLYGEWHDEMATLAACSKVPISGGELHVAGYPELRRMVRQRCYDIFQPDAMWAGGVDQCLRIARLCREEGLLFTPHSWSNGIGFIVNAHIMAASGFAGELPFEYPLCPPGWTVEARDVVLVEPWRHAKGWLEMPQSPGLGIEIDEKQLATFGTCFFRASRREVHWMPEVLRGRAAPQPAASSQPASAG